MKRRSLWPAVLGVSLVTTACVGAILTHSTSKKGSTSTSGGSTGGTTGGTGTSSTSGTIQAATGIPSAQPCNSGDAVPGPRKLRRLTADQLANTVRDLFRSPQVP